MSIRDDFFAAQAKASLWDVAVSIKRGNPLPLDANAVYNALGTATVNGETTTYTAGSLLEYAKTNPVAYPGQICSVVDVDKTTIYYLDQNLDVQPVGIIPTGDNKTIEVTENGAISLLGAANAPTGTLPMIDEETGKIVWRTLEDIGAGDGNDNTTYEFELNDKETGFIVTPLFNGQPIMEGEEGKETQVKYEITLDVYTKGEVDKAIADAVKVVDDKIGLPSIPPEGEEGEGVEATGVYVAIEAVEAKVDGVIEDLADYATTEYVDGEIDALEEAISKLNHFTTKIVADENEVTEEGILYLIKDESVAGVDKYNEYLFVGGEAVLIGDTTTDLSGYALKSELPTEEDFGVKTITGEGAIDVTYAEADTAKQNPEVSLKLDETATNVVLTQSEAGLKAELAENIDVTGTITAKKIVVDPIVDIEGAPEGRVIIDGDNVQFIKYGGSLGGFGTEGVHYNTGDSQSYKLSYEGIETAVRTDDANIKIVKITSNELLLKDNTHTTFHVNENDEGARLQLGETVVTETELAQLNTTLATADELTEHAEYAKETYATKQELSNSVTTADGKYATKEELTAHANTAAETYATKEELTQHGTDADGKYVTKTEFNNHATYAEETYAKSAEVYAKTETYNKTEINKLLDDVTGGSTESAASVKRALDAYIQSTDAEIYGTTLVGEWTTDEGYAPDYTGVSSRIDLNKSAIDEAQADITALELAIHGKAGTDETPAVIGLEGRLAAIEEEVGQVAASRIDGLVATTAQQTKDIAKNTAAIDELNGKTIPALDARIGIPSKPETSEGAGDAVVATGLHALVESLDKTSLKKTEAASTYATITALEAIYKVTGEGENTKVEGALGREITRATAAEAELAGSITALDATLKAAIENDGEGLDSIKELAVWIEDHETDILPILAGFGGEGEPAVIKPYIDEQDAATLVAAKKYTDEQIIAKAYKLPVATVAALGGIKSAADVDGKPAVNKVYVDETTNVAEVKAISTDLLVQGTMMLILNGGDAQVIA